MHRVVDEAGDGFHWPEKQFQQVNAMAAHINERAATTKRRVLPECLGHRWIPAGKLRSRVNGFAEFAFGNQFAGSPVLRLESHHERCPELNTCIATDAHDFFGFSD